MKLTNDQRLNLIGQIASGVIASAPFDCEAATISAKTSIITRQLIQTFSNWPEWWNFNPVETLDMRERQAITIKHEPTADSSASPTRDMFALQAIGQLIKDDVGVGHVCSSLRIKEEDFVSDIHWRQWVAKEAYAIADAMLKERNK